jgi:hypothetical protein
MSVRDRINGMFVQCHMSQGDRGILQGTANAARVPDPIVREPRWDKTDRRPEARNRPPNLGSIADDAVGLMPWAV